MFSLSFTINEIEKLEKIQQIFGHDYLRMLSIYDHLNECKLKYDAYKLEAINIDFDKGTLKKELSKELMDLLILLLIENNRNKENLFEQRLDRFIEKARINNG